MRTTMIPLKYIRLLTLSSIGLFSSLSSPYVSAQIENAAQTNTESKSILVTMLLPVVVDALKGTLTQGSSCFFHKIIGKRMGAIAPSNCTSSQTPNPDNSSNNTVANNNSGSSSVMVTPPISNFTPLPNNELQAAANQPIIGIEIDKLANDQENATVVQQIPLRSKATYDTANNTPLSFDIRNGEVFAVRFTSSVPGRIYLTNIDSKGQATSLGAYEVIGAAMESRVPRRKGIQMVGDPGKESLDIKFIPCVSSQMLSDLRVKQFQNILPDCGGETATKSYQFGSNVTGSGINKNFSSTSTKAMRLLDTGDVNAIAMTAPPDYKNNMDKALSFHINVNHIGSLP